MANSTLNTPLRLAWREHVTELLRYQVWAHFQLQSQLSAAEECVTLAGLGNSPAEAREHLTLVSKDMHTAVEEYDQIVRSFFRSDHEPMGLFPNFREIFVPHRSAPGRMPLTSMEWHWQVTSPAAGSVAVSANEWNELRKTAELWSHRNVHRAISVRAMGELLAISPRCQNRAQTMLGQLREQLGFATQEFWARFTLAADLGLKQEDFLKRRRA